LCDLAGNNVTSGNIDSSPFVWKAVSSTRAPRGYSGKGQQAGLFMFQPRPDTLPGDWSGDELTASTYYKSKAYPSAAATYKDFSLADFIKEFPSQVDGLYQLRMHFGKANYGTYSSTYPATVIQVTGDTWRVVQGGTTNCKAAAAESTELAVGIPQLDPKHSRTETPATAPASTRPSGTSGSGATPSTGQGNGPASGQSISAPLHDAAKGTSASSRSSSTSVAVIGLAALCGLLIVVLVGGTIWRRRRPPAAG
jgi:hypothetical protein